MLLKPQYNANSKKMGSLSIIVGCMYSQKSTSLLRELSADAAVGLKVLYVNHTIDTRSKDAFSTHNPLIKLDGEIKGMKFIKSTELGGLDVSEFDVIGIDEAQFFNDLFETVKIWVDRDSKKVIVVGLDGNSNREKFGQILDLIPLSDSIVKLRPYCKPCADASPRKLSLACFTLRTAKQDDVILVGGSDCYLPVCRLCYLRM